MKINTKNVKFGKLYFFKKNKLHDQYYSVGRNSNDFVGIPIRIEGDVIFILESDMIRPRVIPWWDLTELK